MARKNEATATAEAPTAAEPQENAEAKKKRNRKPSEYRTVQVITIRAHKSVSQFPNLKPTIEGWGEKVGVIVEALTPNVRKGPNKGKLNDRVLKVTFDTNDSYATRMAAVQNGSGIPREEAQALRNLYNDEEVVAKAKAQGISVAELINRALKAK